mmetsp:Transcript_88340/g.285990  ORF Transcript_88340/g.285990 Transcript_88340/m.285990 type:complete len:283 (-) Transcript_88340:1295-2143(-)
MSLEHQPAVSLAHPADSVGVYPAALLRGDPALPLRRLVKAPSCRARLFCSPVPRASMSLALLGGLQWQRGATAQAVSRRPAGVRAEAGLWTAAGRQRHRLRIGRGRRCRPPLEEERTHQLANLGVGTEHPGSALKPQPSVVGLPAGQHLLAVGDRADNLGAGGGRLAHGNRWLEGDCEKLRPWPVSGLMHCQQRRLAHRPQEHAGAAVPQHPAGLAGQVNETIKRLPRAAEELAPGPPTQHRGLQPWGLMHLHMAVHDFEELLRDLRSGNWRRLRNGGSKLH